ncbi:hypothetical protein J437_LFUL018113 [Ladona fulva]|uniref:Regulatory protein zeste n=1 Tax=Ladona fulva TaxID=123851 RepID=A0A8K0P6X0_LADFU|nr:hypothetical protein J437_LFUL018113 [Ladona fulva]
MDSSGITKKISGEQREAMLQFMIENPDLAKNRLSGPQGGIKKTMKWRELATILNSCPTGVSKTPDKWSRSWQDWRSDVKQKASRLRRHAAGTGGGPSKGTPLTALEERLLSFIGKTAVNGVTGIIDPIEIFTLSPDGTVEFALTEEEEVEVMETPASSTPTSGITPPAMRRRANGESLSSSIPENSASVSSVWCGILDSSHPGLLTVFGFAGPLLVRLPSSLLAGLSETLESIAEHIPMEFARKPRTVRDLKRWKATEFRQFLLYTGPYALRKIVSDDRISAFKFVDELQRLKRFVRKKDKPLQKIIRRQAEMGLKATRVSQCSELMKKNIGTLPMGLLEPEFLRVTVKNVKVSVMRPDNYVFLRDGTLCQVLHIATLNGECHIYGQPFKDITDFYAAPARSSKVGIYLASKLGNPRVWTINEIASKAVVIPLKRVHGIQEYYVTDLILL